MKGKAYIAGKITGDERYQVKFGYAQYNLHLDGWLIMNPAILPIGFDYDDYMHVCLAMIDVVDTVFFLPDWTDSEGAKKEHFYATLKGKEIKYLDKACNPSEPVV